MTSGYTCCRWKLAALAMTLGFTSSSHAHRGGLDVYGCHPDLKAGGYHCHQGLLAGLKFDSRAQMLGTTDNVYHVPVNPTATPQPARPPGNPPQPCPVAGDQPPACLSRVKPSKP